MNEANATPHAELIAELMNPNNPKNEREHAAVREIERLREDQQVVDAVAVLTEEGWIWDGDQWQRPPIAQPCPTCEALARTVMLDQTSHDTQREWQGLTDEEMSDIVADIDVDFGNLLWKVVCVTKIIESKLKERNG